MNVGEELARLAQLKADGILTEAEFEQQKAALLARSAAPPHAVSPTQQPVQPGKPATTSGALKGCLIIAGLLILVAVIVAVVGSGGSDNGGVVTAPTAEQAAAALPVTAEQLSTAYDNNEAAAQQQYGNRPLLVSGIVDGVDLDFSDRPFVKLRTSNQFMSAQAKLTEASQPRASGLSKGQSIKLLCTSVSEVVGTPILDGCTIQ